jgi:glucose-1-phosphate adenylyltransferase
MGIYLFRTDLLDSLLKECEGESMSLHVLPAAIQTARVFAYPFEGYWEQVGTLSAFYEANLALTRPDPPFDFYDPLRPIYSRSRFLPSSRIDDCRLGRVVMADGCQIYEADIQECVIGLRSVVRPGARLRQVVLMGADFYETEAERAENRRLGRPHVGIGKGTSIERAVIDKNARIGKGVVIRSHEGQEDRDEDLYSIRDGIVVIPDNTLIPDGTVV